MINVLLFDTEKLTELYTTIGDELKCREKEKEKENISLIVISSNDLLLKGHNIRSKSEDIKRILSAFGKCSFEYTSLTNEIMFYFKDDIDLQDVINSQDSILIRINDLFIDSFKASKEPIFIKRISPTILGFGKWLISLQKDEIYDILGNYGPCERIDSPSTNDFIVNFLDSRDLDDLMKNEEDVLNKIQQIFI